MPPDFLLSLPPAGIFAVILLATAAVSLIILGAFQLPVIRRYSTALSEISPAVLTVTGAIFAETIVMFIRASSAVEKATARRVHQRR